MISERVVNETTLTTITFELEMRISLHFLTLKLDLANLWERIFPTVGTRYISLNINFLLKGQRHIYIIREKVHSWNDENFFNSFLEIPSFIIINISWIIPFESIIFHFTRHLDYFDSLRFEVLMIWAILWDPLSSKRSKVWKIKIIFNFKFRRF